MTAISELEKRVNNIELRNERVEIDKTWETSQTRKILLALFTYLIIGTYMNYLKVDQPWLNAFIPTTGFLLSTLSLPVFKNLWKKYLLRNKF